MEIGERTQGFSRVCGNKSTTAAKRDSVEPGKLPILQIKALSSGSYLAPPRPTEIFAVAALFGTGILITTLVALLSSGKSVATYGI